MLFRSYLDQFVRVFDFFRIAVRRGGMTHLELLFAGKVAFSDLPALAEALAEAAE